MKVIAILLLTLLFIPPSYANIDKIAYQLRRMADAEEKANVYRACRIENEFVSKPGRRIECRKIAIKEIDNAVSC